LESEIAHPNPGMTYRHFVLGAAGDHAGAAINTATDINDEGVAFL